MPTVARSAEQSLVTWAGRASLGILLLQDLALIPLLFVFSIIGTLGFLFLVARVTEPPLNDFVSALNLYPLNQKPFLNGVLRQENVLYYVAVAYVFLLAATHTLRARRWR